jgi:hypothetical protein
MDENLAETLRCLAESYGPKWHAYSACMAGAGALDAQKWKPMDSAPKDGTEILVCAMFWDWDLNKETPQVGIALFEERNCGFTDGYWVGEEGCAYSPVPYAWMPKPLPIAPVLGKNN